MIKSSCTTQNTFGDDNSMKASKKNFSFIKVVKSSWLSVKNHHFHYLGHPLCRDIVLIFLVVVLRQNQQPIPTRNQCISKHYEKQYTLRCFGGCTLQINFPNCTVNTTLSCNISNMSNSVASGYPNTEKIVENTMQSGVVLLKFKVFG